MKPEIEQHFQKRLDAICISFRELCEDNVIQYATAVMGLEKRESLTTQDIDRAFLALGMATAEEITERRNNVVTTDIA